MEEINLNYMSFSEAMQNLLERKSVARVAWGGTSMRLTETGRIAVFYGEDQEEEWYEDLHVDMEDVTAVDWYVK